MPVARKQAKAGREALSNLLWKARTPGLTSRGPRGRFRQRKARLTVVCSPVAARFK